MGAEILEEATLAMNMRVDAYKKSLARMRTGKASVSLLDNVLIGYYGSPTPINQVASLATPDARTLVISPFDKQHIKDIEKAILAANLGLQPSSDGQVIRISIPPLTKDRRAEIAKGLSKVAEDAKVAVRAVRKSANDRIKKIEKDKDISQDESKDLQGEVQDLTNKYIKKVDEITSQKEKEILTL
ncbi:MAG: ribosome recycling factor [Proteobacteria bacterium]|nr:ribosome recycling factor [Pseudomonadota bacterium]